MQTNGGLFEAPDADLLAVDVLRLDESVTVADEECFWPDGNGTLFVGVIFKYAEHHAPFVQAHGLAMANQKRREVSSVGVAQRSGRAVIDGDEEGGEPVVSGIADKMPVEPGNQLGGT